MLAEKNTYSLVGQVVCLKFSVVGILNEDRLVAKVWSGSGVVVYHCDSCVFRSHFYESLGREAFSYILQEKTCKLYIRVHLSPPSLTRGHTTLCASDYGP